MQHRVLNLDNVKLIKHRLRDGFCPVSKVGGDIRCTYRGSRGAEWQALKARELRAFEAPKAPSGLECEEQIPLPS